MGLREAVNTRKKSFRLPCPCIVSCSEKIEANTNKEVVGSDFGKWEKRKKLLTTMRKLDAT